MEPYIHVFVLSVDAETAGGIVQRVRATVEAALLQGFISLTVLVSDDETRIALVSEWKDQHDWGRAQWNDRIQDGVVDLFRSAKQVDSRGYREVFRYPSA